MSDSTSDFRLTADGRFPGERRGIVHRCDQATTAPGGESARQTSEGLRARLPEAIAEERRGGGGLHPMAVT